MWHSRPPSSLLSFLFPPILPFLSCHPWAGGWSLWEVKGHYGWEGSRQVVRAPCSLFPTACVKCCWTLTPVGPYSENQCGTQFSQPDPIQDRTFYWRRKESPPPHPNCGQCSPIVCWSSRVGRPAATGQDKTSETLFSMWFDPQVPLLTHRDQTLGISGGSHSWSFSSIETYPFDKTQND